VKASRDVEYRIALAEGFLREAEQDFELERWRSCVDNAQIAVENAGKTALALFGIAPKTHDPARQIAVILAEWELSKEMADLLNAMLPDLLALGSETHFLTDYGDESNYRLPWELFTRETAEDALQSARRLIGIAQELQALSNQ
jgi:HEPN domain-containing protein